MIKTIVAILNYLENVDVTAGIACATIVSVWFRSKKDPGKMGGVKHGVGEGGWGGGGERKESFFSFPSSSLFHFLVLDPFSARPKAKIPFLPLPLCPETARKRLLRRLQLVEDSK